jgi:MarR family transcriptional regulator, organic hydroperoxide resistance regulator
MPNIDSKAEALVTIIRSLIRRSRRQERRLAGSEMANLSHNETEALICIAVSGKITMTQLATEIMLSTSSATQIADKLLQKKLVFREHSSEDRRVVTIRLTAQGERIYKAFNAEILRRAHGALKSLNAKEQDLLIALFSKIADKLAGHEE